MRGGLRRLDALGAVDGAGLSVAPASVLLERAGGLWRVLASGRPEDVDRHPAAGGAARENLPGSVLFPGLVNAHTHLDLTHLGPREHDPARGFVPWVDMVRTGRRADDEGIAESVRRGIELVLAGGTVAVGDIAGSARGKHTLAPWRALRDAGLTGVSYLENFGIGPGQPTSASRLAAFLEESRGEIAAANRGPLRIGLQPHAPNTVSLPHYRFNVEWATKLAMPLSTHLAETPEERQFVAACEGPQHGLLQSLGLWDDRIRDNFAGGEHPVQHLRTVLAGARFLVAHVNDADDAAIETLARTGTSVAYCPRASEYFAAADHFGPHRYRDMLRAGVNVALGTDSIVNLPPEAAAPARGGMSVLDEMRLLFRRDGTDPLVLLRMGSLSGAAALGLDPSRFRLGPGDSPGGIVAVEVDGRAEGPFEAVLRSSSPPRVVLGPVSATQGAPV